MRSFVLRTMLALLLLIALAAGSLNSSYAQKLYEPKDCIYPEQHHIHSRGPHQIWSIPGTNPAAPQTVVNPECPGAEQMFSLDQAIAVALENAEVIRVLGGSSGLTVYDPAIANTRVDVERGAFDPSVTVDGSYNRDESYVPQVARIGVAESDALNLSASISQRKVTGTTVSGSFSALPINSDPGGFLDPQTPTLATVGVTQPLLRGGDPLANRAPIVIARLDTERSFYQLKDSVQELVRGTVEGYWSIVAAKVSVWATEQQIAQLEFALKFFQAQQKVGRTNAGDTAQTQVSLANFRANLIAAEADLLNREAALRNLLGLPPVDEACLVPVTPPLTERRAYDWEKLIDIAQHHRPDIIDLKLRIESDEQQLLIADNNALPTVNAVANRTINGLFGRNTATGAQLGRFGAADIELGLEVNLPLGLRADRALLRQAEISLARDRALLDQQFHAVTHIIAQNVRNLEQFYEQYEAFRKVREAARISLDIQLQSFRTGRVTYLNVLLAVTDWGNAVSSEANALALYNIELASLQRQVGTIMEEHGVRFYEEQYGSWGPKFDCRCYAESLWPSENQPRYETGDEPSEESFDLESQVPETSGRRKQRPDATDADELEDRMRRPDEDSSDEERAQRLRQSLGSPQSVEPLRLPENQPSAERLPRPTEDAERAPVKPADPPSTPPQEGRIPGDDLRELLDQMEGLSNPFEQPESNE